MIFSEKESWACWEGKCWKTYLCGFLCQGSVSSRPDEPGAVPGDGLAPLPPPGSHKLRPSSSDPAPEYNTASSSTTPGRALPPTGYACPFDRRGMRRALRGHPSHLIFAGQEAQISLELPFLPLLLGIRPGISRSHICALLLPLPFFHILL